MIFDKINGTNNKWQFFKFYHGAKTAIITDSSAEPKRGSDGMAYFVSINPFFYPYTYGN